MIIANTLLLEPYYISKQGNTLKEHFQTINAIDSLNYQTSFNTFASIETSSNVDILILDTNEILIYGSRNYLQNPFNTLPRPPLEITKTIFTSEAYDVLIGNDSSINKNFIILSGTLDNDYHLELRTPLESIRTNIIITNKFLIYIGTVILLLAMALTYILSNNVAKPIRNINDVTKKMKNLDFSTNLSITSKDEIGELSKNINNLAESLSNTIHDLYENNKILKKEMLANKMMATKRRELLNNVSHELKTPLSLIQGYAEGLSLNMTKSKSKSDFYCSVIMEETLKMTSLVEELLELDQSEFGEHKNKFCVFEVNAFVQKICDKYSKTIEDSSITFSLQKIDNINVYYNIVLAERVLSNYLSNAICYVDQKKTISISIKDLEKTIRIEIYNTCDPLDNSTLEKLWDSFFKADSSRTRSNGGHGLGLSIVKAIQVSLGFEYGCKSVESGIIFWFDMGKNLKQ
ncbi:MAG: HAMP domain-containing sensor histidine kinase [Bacilli bacterium]